jgi:hypothetical protein
MKIAMTLMVRDEVDIIDLQIAFHLAAGVDYLIVTDHESVDGTSEILDRYARQGVLHLIPVTSPIKRQAEWVTNMARMAAVEFGADWVLNSDADEFWWPWGGDLKAVLGQIPERYGVVQTFMRTFLPRPGDGPFAERMTVRFAPAAPINSPFSPFRVNVRLLHRGSADIIVGRGNHTVRTSLAPFPARSPVEVLHFPIRSYRQFERKFLTHYKASGARRRGEHVRAYEAAQTGRLPGLYDEVCVTDDRLRGGLEDGTLATDTRLRDALRSLATDPASSPVFPPRSAADEVGYAVDGAVLEAGELVRLQRRVDELRTRVTLRSRRS